MDLQALAFAGPSEQARLVRARQISPRELVELYLERIEANDELRAFRAVAGERALAAADEQERLVMKGEAGPLAGVCIAIKDNIDVAGDVTTYGTDAYDRRPARQDAELVRRLRSVGAIPLGRTLMPELAMWPFTESPRWGRTENPWCRGYTVGGSSGGSAVAVTAGLAAAATASDGAGSIRIPAACCGLFGLKPERSLLPLAPLLEHWHGMTVAGYLTRSVEDTALLIDATSASSPRANGPAGRHRTAPTSPLRIAISAKPLVPEAVVDDEVREAVREMAGLLGSLGHKLEESDPDYGNFAVESGYVPRYFAGLAVDAAALGHPERLEQRTQEAVALGQALRGEPLAHARKAEAAYAQRVNALFATYDLLMTPVLAGPPVPADSWERLDLPATVAAAAKWAAFTAVWNVTGQAAASVPAGRTHAGLPLAVQFIAPAGGQGLLLSVARQIEAARPWSHDQPKDVTSAGLPGSDGSKPSLASIPLLLWHPSQIDADERDRAVPLVEADGVGIGRDDADRQVLDL